MESCKGCALYSESYDTLNRDFNDVGDENEHFCPMYTDAIPDGIFEGNKECPHYMKREGNQ